MSNFELTVMLDKKLSFNYNSVGLSASIRLMKPAEDLVKLESDLTAMKLTLETWIDEQLLDSARGLPMLANKAKQLSDIPY